MYEVYIYTNLIPQNNIIKSRKICITFEQSFQAFYIKLVIKKLSLFIYINYKLLIKYQIIVLNTYLFYTVNEIQKYLSIDSK